MLTVKTLLSTCCVYVVLKSLSRWSCHKWLLCIGVVSSLWSSLLYICVLLVVVWQEEAISKDEINFVISLYLQQYFCISPGLWENSWRPAIRYRIQPSQSSATLQISQRCHQSQIQTSALIQIQNYSLCDNSGTLTHRRNTGISVCVEYGHWLILHHGI